MHHHREETYTYSEKSLEACHIGFSQHSTLLYLMNNLYGSSVSDHIGSMDHHRDDLKACKSICEPVGSYRENKKGILPML